jgi:uncharacterized protein YhfF
MMLDEEERPRFIRCTTEITIKPLSEVDEVFAWDEGEGDRTRDWWMAAHRSYFGRQASRKGFQFDDDIPYPCSSASRSSGRSISRIPITGAGVN